MEPFKRKRRDDAGIPRRPPPPPARAPPPPEEDDRAVTDDVVEEFFAMLSRMHEATRYLSVGQRPVPAPPPESESAVARMVSGNRTVATWNPTFAWEDFAGPQEASKNGDERGIGGDGEEKQLPIDPSPAAEDGEAAEENKTPRYFDLNSIPEEFDGLAVAMGESSQ